MDPPKEGEVPMNNKFTGHALCQAMLLEDIPQRAEASIEGYIRNLWKNSGPDFVLDYLKVLKKETENSLTNPDYRYSHENGSPSIRWNRSANRPRGPLGYIYKRFPEPIQRVRVIGAIIQAISYEVATKKQLDKFVKNVRFNFKSSNPLQLSDHVLYTLERNLTKRVREVTEPFSMVDLTNNVLPYGAESHATARNKALLQNFRSHSGSSDEGMHRAVLELYADMLGQFYTAPRICKTYWNRALKLANVDPSTREKVAYPSKVTPRPYMAREYHTNKQYDDLLDNAAEYSDKEKCDLLGRLDFLQKPGGKLRSVANVNRFVNFTLEPYAKALEDTFYMHPEIKVCDQHAGLAKAQQLLAEGHELSSLDLTAATDRLDFRVFTHSLCKPLPGLTGLLACYALYFEKLAQLPLWCEGLGADIQFRTGQPLGMKGSFQTLTIMNYYAGSIARKLCNGEGEFVVVGDDFVCTSNIAEAYNKVITSWGGETNAEKAMRSSTYAEFLSHIVTKDRVYITKPKYRPSNKALFVNAEKATVRKLKHIYRLSQEETNALDILSEYSVDEMDYRSNLPNLRTHDTQTSNDDLRIMAAALDVLTELKDQPDTSTEISRLTLDLLEKEDPSIRRYLFGNDQVEQLPIGTLNQDSVLTVPTSVSAYNHRSARTEEKQSLRQQYQSTLDRAKEITAINTSLTSNQDVMIPISGNTAVSSEAVVLQAMKNLDDQEDQQVPNRKEATQLPKRKKIIVPIDIIDSDDYEPNF